MLRRCYFTPSKGGMIDKVVICTQFQAHARRQYSASALNIVGASLPERALGWRPRRHWRRRAATNRPTYERCTVLPSNVRPLYCTRLPPRISSSSTSLRCAVASLCICRYLSSYRVCVNSLDSNRILTSSPRTFCGAMYMQINTY